ncbi:MAG: ABC transporter permease subunit [Anaerolineaceae bacterium]|nr:ABC transporter permease subunit [Anaerolineaceae bacterium]
MHRIRTIIGKEWEEVFRNRMVLFTVIFLPLLFTAMMLGFLFAFDELGGDDSLGSIPAEFGMICPEDVSEGECVKTYMMSQFMMMYIFVPLIIPINIAAYSIVGEKRSRSLEPLLATPLTTTELLLGKMLAAVIPAVLATWGGFILFSIGSVIVLKSFGMILTLFAAGWLVAIGLLGPLLAVLSVCFCLMVSSRVNDPRVAEQISSVIILPVLVLLVGQVSGFLLFNANVAWILSLVMVFLDAFMVYLCVQLFEREHILTRWK